jgi:probable O-glycosylation ligase (exosortase A-associated)
MKQTLFMTMVTLLGVGGVFVNGPFAAAAVYYLFAVLRPQYLWVWALPPDIAWSQIVAIAALIAFVLYSLEVSPFRPDGEPEFGGVALSHKLYLAFGVWVMLSYFTAQNKDVAGYWLIEYLKVFTMFTVGILVVRRVQQVWQLYLIATCALIYIGYEVNSLYFFQGRMDMYKNGYGGLDNNGAGLMLAMGVPLSLYGFEASRRWWRWGLAAAIPVLIHAVLMTYSRGAMVSLIIATPMMIMRSRRRWQFGLIVLLMAFAVPVMAGPEIRARFLTLQNYQNDESANSRFGSWQAALRIADDYPLFGVGIRNSNLFSHQYGADMEGRTIHSQYLQILADSGYVAFLCYIAAIVTLLLAAFRARRKLKKHRSEETDLMRSILNGVEGAMLVFAVGSTFLSLEVFELPYLMALLAGQLTVLTRQLAAEEKFAEESPRTQAVPAFHTPAVARYALARGNRASRAR